MVEPMERAGQEGGWAIPDPVPELSDEALIPVKSRTRLILETWLPPIVGLVVLLVVWIGLIRWKNTPPILAPSPGDVINGMRDNSSDLLIALRSTAQDAFLGLAL